MARAAGFLLDDPFFTLALQGIIHRHTGIRSRFGFERDAGCRLVPLKCDILDVDVHGLHV